MARKLTYNINRFDGGMTSSPRDVNQRDKFALISHFDIYREIGKMHVMPGFESFNAFDGSATGLKVYGVRAIGDIGSTLFALGTKSDGTGTKIFQYNLNSGSEWIIPTFSDLDVEGTATLPARPFIFYNDQAEAYFPAFTSPRVYLVEQGPNANGGAGGIDATFGTLHVGSQGASTYTVEKGFDGSYYMSKSGYNGVARLASGGVYTENAKSTSFGTYDVQSGSYQLGITGALTPQARSILWDSASLLADESLFLGQGRARVIGYPSSVWTFIVSEGEDGYLSNEKVTMFVKYAVGDTVENRYAIESQTSTNLEIEPIQGDYGNTLTWYARIPTNSAGTEFIQGFWAFGKGTDAAQMGVSVLLDTTSLGYVVNATWLGNNLFVCHSNDGSVSRLSGYDTGAYDVKATAETVWYGNETPYQKELNGITVVTNPLPANATVEMFYRVNDGASWTSMGVSDTDGKMKHTFTRVSGVPIGKFQEIQFKFEVLGKVSVQNVFINITETDDLAF